MSTLNKKLGFTIVEITLAITISILLVGLFSNYYNNARIRGDLSAQAASIVYYLRLANSSAMSGLNDENHAVHFENNSYTIFEGDSFNPADPANYEVSLPDSITISDINLNGSGQDVVFSKSNGETTNFGTLTLNAANINKAINIAISPEGIINY